MLSPVCGVVPVGGVALILATLTPNAVMKFDSQVNVAVRNGKSVEIRVSGSVEPPLVDIDMVCPTFSCVIHMNLDYFHSDSCSENRCQSHERRLLRSRIFITMGFYDRFLFCSVCKFCKFSGGILAWLSGMRCRLA